MRSIRTVIIGLAIVVSGAGCAHRDEVAQFDGNTMGTTYRVTYVSSGDQARLPAQVEELLARINQSLSTYISDSMIARLNAANDTAAWYPVDTDFDLVFRRARAIYDDTGGAFNPALGPLVNAWGFGPARPESLPAEDTIRALLKLAALDSFELRAAPPAIRKRIAEAQLDFGGIAKGYAVDAMAALLEQAGVKDYLVQISGEVRARGHRPLGSGWRVGIEQPAGNAVASPKIQAVLSLENAALATSGNYRNYRSDDGKTFGHILNPKTGYPVENSLLSVSVLAPDAMTADAYATALVVMGLDDAQRFVAAHEQLKAYFIARDREGNLIERRSPGFPEADVAEPHRP